MSHLLHALTQKINQHSTISFFGITEDEDKKIQEEVDNGSGDVLDKEETTTQQETTTEAEDTTTTEAEDTTTTDSTTNEVETTGLQGLDFMKVLTTDF